MDICRVEVKAQLLLHSPPRPPLHFVRSLWGSKMGRGEAFCSPLSGGGSRLQPGGTDWNPSAQESVSVLARLLS